MYILATPILVFFALIQCSYASPSSYPGGLDLPSSAIHGKRDQHDQHAAPLLDLNETELTLYHAPTLPSYYTIDWEDEGHEKRYGSLMIVHGLFMCLAFFVALPMGS